MVCIWKWREGTEVINNKEHILSIKKSDCFHVVHTDSEKKKTYVTKTIKSFMGSQVESHVDVWRGSDNTIRSLDSLDDTPYVDLPIIATVSVDDDSLKKGIYIQKKEYSAKISEDGILDFALSKDFTYAVTAHVYGQARVYNIERGENLRCWIIALQKKLRGCDLCRAVFDECVSEDDKDMLKKYAIPE